MITDLKIVEIKNERCMLVGITTNILANRYFRLLHFGCILMFFLNESIECNSIRFTVFRYSFNNKK